jgi:iron complex transport system substrate-binding protein
MHEWEDRLSRRFTFLVALLTLILIACGARAGNPSTQAPTATTAAGGAPFPAPTVSGPATEAATAGATVGGATAATLAPTAVAAPTAGSTALPGATATQASVGATATGSGAASRAGYPFTYTDASGTKVTLREQPRRIVSLFPINNNTVFAIGAGDQVIAVDEFTTSPREATEKPKIRGDYQKFDVEGVVRLRPDLVLTSFTDEILDKPLRRAGVTVISMPYPSTLQGVYKHIQDLGRIMGHSTEAGRAVAKLQGEVAQVRGRAEKARKVRVYYEADISTPGKPYTVGSGSLVDELIAISGGRNVFGNSKLPSLQVGYEAIVKADPEVMVLGDVKGFVGPGFYNPTTVEEVKRREGFATTRAVKANRVVPINAEAFIVPGPQLSQGLRNLAAIIHPEIFGER